MLFCHDISEELWPFLPQLIETLIFIMDLSNEKKYSQIFDTISFLLKYLKYLEKQALNYSIEIMKAYLFPFFFHKQIHVQHFISETLIFLIGKSNPFFLLATWQIVLLNLEKFGQLGIAEILDNLNRDLENWYPVVLDIMLHLKLNLTLVLREFIDFILKNLKKMNAKKIFSLLLYIKVT